MSIDVSKSLDYSHKELSAGSYTLRIVNPENGQPSLQQSSTISTDFLLPNKVFNLSRSYLNFNLECAGEVNQFNHIHSGFLAAIDGIVLRTAGGVTLVEMNNLPEYTKVAWRPQTNYEDFMTFPCHNYSTATAAAVTQPGQLFNRIRAANGTASDAAFAASSYHCAAEDGKTYVAASDDYTAVANYVVQETKSAGNAVRVQLPLKMIYGSLLAVDKDLYFGEQIRLTIRWNQWAKTAWNSPTTTYDVAGASTDIGAAPALTGVQLQIAMETNDAIVQNLIQKIESGSGIQINVPYTYVHKAVGANSANSNATIIRKVNRGMGSKLLRVLVGVYSDSANQIGFRYCNNYNYGSTKWSGYRTYLDSIPIQDNNLLMSDFSVWQYHSDKLKGSVCKDFRDWAQCPTIIQDFSGVPRTCDYPETDHVVAGLDLAREREFALQLYNVAANLTVLFFFVCQKQLSISKSAGISLQ